MKARMTAGGVALGLILTGAAMVPAASAACMTETASSVACASAVRNEGVLISGEAVGANPGAGVRPCLNSRATAAP